MKSKVLIVDDCESINKVLYGTLETQKISCDIATSEQEAKEMLKKGHYWTVILDVNLGGSSSFGLAGFIRERSLKTQILIISGNMNEAIFYEYIKLGASDFFSKTQFNIVAILESIKLSHLRHERWSGLFPEVQ